ncbi:MAG: hypothetical protein ACLP5E_21615 [Streptosporangiaceae bacterium]
MIEQSPLPKATQAQVRKHPGPADPASRVDAGPLRVWVLAHGVPAPVQARMVGQ